MAERLILALDGATGVCSAALLRLAGRSGIATAPGESADEYVVEGARAGEDSRGQAKLLLPMVDSLLGQTGGSPDDLGAVVVGVGPGTFTGVRIAVATARALSLALGIPIAGVGTLGALAAHSAAVLAAEPPGHGEAFNDGAAAGDHVRWIVPVVDARRGQVFYAKYGRLGSRWVRQEPVGVCDRSLFVEVLEEAGGGRVMAVAEREGLVESVSQNVEVVVRPVGAEWLVAGQWRLVEPGREPAGQCLGPWLNVALRDGAPVVPEAIKPLYVRSPDADVHITKMRDPWTQTPPNESSKGMPQR
jgi:tRNA threonylcarbamoyl adenosine modification protein YeaZ